MTAISAILMTGRPDPVPVVLDGRDGHTLFVRELDPGDELQPFEFDPTTEAIVLMTAIGATFLCATPQVGADDALTPPIRVVPDGRDGPNVYMRTLRHGEADDGRRVHVRPGEIPVFRAGSLVIELDALDEHFTLGLEGYAPLANTVWTWLTITGKGRNQARDLYVLAAARRLDGAAVAWTRSKELLRSIETVAEGSFNPQVRATVVELLACVELAIIALQRVVRMVEQALEDVGADTPVPEIVTRLGPHLTAIRDAFEHIDERALGTVRRARRPEATSVFDQHRLLSEGAIVYGKHRIAADEITELLASCRQFLKDVVALA